MINPQVGEVWIERYEGAGSERWAKVIVSDMIFSDWGIQRVKYVNMGGEYQQLITDLFVSIYRKSL